MSLKSPHDETQIEFSTWVETATPNDLAVATVAYEGSRRLLWMSGADDSYRRDRHERDQVLTEKLVACKRRLRELGFSSGC